MQIFVKLTSGKSVTIDIEMEWKLKALFEKFAQKNINLEGHYITFIHPKTNQVVQFDINSPKDQTLVSMGMDREITLEIISGKMPPFAIQTNVTQQHQQIPTFPPIQPQLQFQTGQQLPQQSIQSSNNQLFQQEPIQTYQPFNQNQFQQPFSQQATGQLNDPQVLPWQQQQWQQNTPPAQQQHYSPNQSIQQQVQPQLQVLQNQINLLQTQLDHQNGELAWYKKFYEENKQLQPHQMISKLTLQPLIQQLQELVAIRPE